MNKRAMEIGAQALKAMIIIFIVTLLLMYATNRIARTNQELSTKQMCKLSVLENSKARISTLGVDWVDSINCPTEDKVIKHEEDLAIKKELADLMFDCWDIWGRGQLELFPTELATTTNYCSICYLVDFEHEGKEVKGFWNYLVENNAPREDHSYMTEFTREESADAYRKIESPGTTISFDTIIDDPKYFLDTDNRYAIAFSYSKDSKFFTQTTVGTIAGVGGAVTVVAASAILTGGISLVGIGLAAIVGGSSGVFAAMATPSGPVSWYPGIWLVPYTADDLSVLDCEVLVG